MRSFALLLALTALATSAVTASSTTTWAALAALPVPAADSRVTYGTAPSQFYTVSMPTGAGPHPVVVLAHGGCWLKQFDLGYMAHLGEALRARGWAVFNVEYRRLGEEGAGLPGTPDDLRRAVAQILANRQGHPLDPKRVVLVGHSAGGHLALLAAVSHPRAAGVVGLAAITDLAGYAGEPTQGCPDSARRLTSTGSSDGQDPARLPAPQGAVVLLSGERDTIVPRRYGDTYAALHAKVRHEVAPGAGHFDLVMPGTPAFARVVELIESIPALP